MASRAPRFSVIIPTYQRRELVLRAVEALLRQQYTESYEIIVVVDGSVDGTADALRNVRSPTPLRILEQPNSGASHARNVGAAAARGELLLFLDDDMVAAPDLLAELDRSHRDGADAAFGQMPLHPGATPTIISRAVGAWAAEHARHLSAISGSPPWTEVFSGQLSVRREVFFGLGGFDARFTRHATYGNEDVDFAYRLVSSGARIRFNAAAVSYQWYAVGATRYFRQWRDVGVADVTLVRKHPHLRREIFDGQRASEPLLSALRVPCLVFPRLLGRIAGMVAPRAAARVDAGRDDALTKLLFLVVRGVGYWQGVRSAGGDPRRGRVLVLCYHAVEDLAGAGPIEPYGVPEATFRDQIETLRRHGYHFIEPEEFVRFLNEGAGVPRRAVLLTFDDAYRSVSERAMPFLVEAGIPAVIFAVSGSLGGSDEWNRVLGTRALRVMDADALRDCVAQGFVVGAHSRTHRSLCGLPRVDLHDEIGGSMADLSATGIPTPMMFAYPYGECDGDARRVAAESGAQAAFGLGTGRARPHCNPFLVPRVEVLRSDVGWRFRAKVWTAGRFPLVWQTVRVWLRAKLGRVRTLRSRPVTRSA